MVNFDSQFWLDWGMSRRLRKHTYGSVEENLEMITWAEMICPKCGQHCEEAAASVEWKTVEGRRSPNCFFPLFVSCHDLNSCCQGSCHDILPCLRPRWTQPVTGSNLWNHELEQNFLPWSLFFFLQAFTQKQKKMTKLHRILKNRI